MHYLSTLAKPIVYSNELTLNVLGFPLPDNSNITKIFQGERIGSALKVFANFRQLSVPNFRFSNKTLLAANFGPLILNYLSNNESNHVIIRMARAINPYTKYLSGISRAFLVATSVFVLIIEGPVFSGIAISMLGINCLRRYRKLNPTIEKILYATVYPLSDIYCFIYGDYFMKFNSIMNIGTYVQKVTQLDLFSRFSKSLNTYEPPYRKEDEIELVKKLNETAKPWISQEEIAQKRQVVDLTSEESFMKQRDIPEVFRLPSPQKSVHKVFCTAQSNFTNADQHDQQELLKRKNILLYTKLYHSNVKQHEKLLRDMISLAAKNQDLPEFPQTVNLERIKEVVSLSIDSKDYWQKIKQFIQVELESYQDPIQRRMAKIKILFTAQQQCEIPDNCRLPIQFDAFENFFKDMKAMLQPVKEHLTLRNHAKLQVLGEMQAQRLNAATKFLETVPVKTEIIDVFLRKGIGKMAGLPKTPQSINPNLPNFVFNLLEDYHNDVMRELEIPSHPFAYIQNLALAIAESKISVEVLQQWYESESSKQEPLFDNLKETLKEWNAKCNSHIQFDQSKYQAHFKLLNEILVNMNIISLQDRDMQ